MVCVDSVDGRRRRGGATADGCAIACGSGSGRGAVPVSRARSGWRCCGVLPAGGRGGRPHPLAAVVLLSLCLAAEQFTDAIYWAAAISVAGRRASAACGLMNTGGNLSGGVVALVVPLVVDRFGWPAALATGSAFALVGGRCSGWSPRPTSRWMSGCRSPAAA